MSFDRDRWQHACIYIWTNKIAGSTSRVEESSMLVSSTGAVGGRLQHPVWIRRDLIMEEVHGISNSIPFVADISMESLHQHVNCLHHYGVEGTTACQGSSWIHSIRRQRSNRSHISTDGWRRRWKSLYRIDQGELMIKSIHKRAQFSNRLQELKQLQLQE